VLRALGDEAAARQACSEAGRRARRGGARSLLGGGEEAAVAGRPSPSVATRDPWSGLSPRQRDTARQLCGGLTNKEIAARLGLSVRTVDMHVADVLKRLGCRTRAEAAAKITAMLA
jgi:DNA-binding CsgD family transcriptional regulator